MVRPLRTSGDRGLGSVLVDVGVVVVGVLIAFALNSWWAHRNEEARRSAHLRALAHDVDRNLAALEGEIATRRRVVEESLSLFELLRRAETIPRDTAVTLLRDIYQSSQYEPVLGAYENVVNSGGLSQLGDSRLQAEIARLVADLRNDYYRRFGGQIYRELLRQFPSVVGYLGVQDEAPPAIHSAGAPSLDSILSRPDFQSLVYARMLSARNVERRLRDLQQRLRSVLKEIRRKLPEDGARLREAADSAPPAATVEPRSTLSSRRYRPFVIQRGTPVSLPTAQGSARRGFP